MIETITQSLLPLRERLLSHRLYDEMTSVQDIQVFTEYHVYAVWDFMSLLKGLQQQLTCVNVPWVPSGNSDTCRFINEIVMGEESDTDKEGHVLSHFEMYLEAMEELGGNTDRVLNFVNEVKKGLNPTQALLKVNASEAVVDFVNFTFEVIATKKPHIIAAVFTFGREDLIPELFLGIVKKLQKTSNTKLEKLIYYLERHIELDGDEHGPLSLQMVKNLCGGYGQKWDEAIKYSKIALIKRIALWEEIALVAERRRNVLSKAV